VAVAWGHSVVKSCSCRSPKRPSCLGREELLLVGLPLGLAHPARTVISPGVLLSTKQQHTPRSDNDYPLKIERNHLSQKMRDRPNDDGSAPFSGHTLAPRIGAGTVRAAGPGLLRVLRAPPG